MRCKIFQLLLPFFSLPLSAAYIKQPFPHSDLFDAIHSGSPYIISNSHPAFLGRLHAPLPPGPPLNNPGGQRSFSSPNPSPPPWVKHPPQDATSYSNSSEVSGGISSVQWSRVAGESLTLQVLRFENEGVLPRQECPGMVGPGSDGAYYCSEREKGYCDRRSGTCWCYAGYAGEDCSECDPFHHQDPSRPISASLRCIPNRLCPNDCSAAGACNYTTGQCSCAAHRRDKDCSLSVCSEAHCAACDASHGCTQCAQGFFLLNDSQSCHPCTLHDPFCTTCDAVRCISCADPLLFSSSRSGLLRHHPTSSLHTKYPQWDNPRFDFATQEPAFFDNAQVYSVQASAAEAALSCDYAKGVEANRSVWRGWSCDRIPHQPRRICGHNGRLSFTSNTYAVRENATFLRVAVERSGGGFGPVSVRFRVEHGTTDEADVSVVGGDRTLRFPPLVVRLSFLIKVHDDAEVEPDEYFYLRLYDPKGGATIGRPAAKVIIADDDFLRAYKASIVPDTIGPMVAGNVLNVSVRPQTVSGRPMNSSAYEGLELEESFVIDLEHQLHFCESLRCTVRPTIVDPVSGNASLSLQIARRGGLKARYSTSVNGKAVTRIDPDIDFSWAHGAIIYSARQQVSIVWEGGIVSEEEEVEVWLDAPNGRASLSIDGNTRISPLLPSSTAHIRLQRSHIHRIKVSFVHSGGHARCRLLWRADPSSPFRIIPSDNLLHFTPTDTLSFPLLPASPDPSLTFATAVKGALAVAGEPTVFVLHPRDRFNNTANAAEALWTASIGTVNAQSSPPTLTFTPIHAGELEVNLTLGSGQPIYGFPVTLEVLPAKPAAAATSWHLLSPTPTAGQPLRLGIVFRDAFSNLVSDEAKLPILDIFVEVEGQKFQAKPEPLNRSIYSATVSQAGLATVHASLQGAPLSTEEPSTITIAPATLSNSKSKVMGEGLLRATAGLPATIRVYPRDAFGNEVDASTVAISLTLREDGSSSQSFSCTPTLPSVLNCSYVALKAGRATVELLGSVHVVTVTDGSPSVNRSFVVTENSYRAAEASEFFVVVRDAAGNNRSEEDAVNCNVGGGNVSAAFIENGRYSVRFMLSQAGISPATCFLNADPLQTFNISIRPNSVNHVRSSIHFEALPHVHHSQIAESYAQDGQIGQVVGAVRAGDPFTVGVQGKDASGNNVSEACFFQLSANEDVVDGEHLGDGWHALTLTLNAANQHQTLRLFLLEPSGMDVTFFANPSLINPILSSQASPDSSDPNTWRILSPSPTNVSFSSARYSGYILLPSQAKWLQAKVHQAGLRVKLGSTAANSLDAWPIANRSWYTLPLPLGVAGKPNLVPLVVEFNAADVLHNSSLELRVLDNTRSPSAGLPIQLLNRREITESPFVLQVLANVASPQHSSASVPDAIIAGEPKNAVVISRDAQYNVRSACDDAVVAVAVHVQSLSVHTISHPSCEQGRYTLPLNLTTAGSWQVYFGLNPPALPEADLGISHALLTLPQVSGSPLSFVVTNARAYRVIYLPPVVRTVAGDVSKVLVQLRDAFGNPVDGCEDDVNVLPPFSSTASLKCLGGGNYRLDFVPKEAGLFNLTLALRGFPKESLEVTVVHAKPSANRTTLARIPGSTALSIAMKDSYGNPARMVTPRLVFQPLLPTGIGLGYEYGNPVVDPVRRVVQEANGTLTVNVAEGENNASFAVGLEVSIAEGDGLQGEHTINGRLVVINSTATTLDYTIDHEFVQDLLHVDAVDDTALQAFGTNTELSWKGFVLPERSTNYSFLLRTTPKALTSLHIAGHKASARLSLKLRAGQLYPIQARVRNPVPFTRISLMWASDLLKSSPLWQLPGTASVTQFSATVTTSTDLQAELEIGDLIYISGGTTTQAQAYELLHYDSVFQRITLNQSYTGASTPNATLLTPTNASTIPMENLLQRASPVQGSPVEDIFAQET